ncbi:hypothetical protein [Arthrobacter sp. NPDC089319]|uniref:hypothetical protein n=1 Tax=Arthrobacter sp. NPDC089319 TaxID=3155915 RepID=UPI0034457176
MERVLPLLTAAVLLAALAGCSANADGATVPRAAEQGLSRSTAATDGAASVSTSMTNAASAGNSPGVATARTSPPVASYAQSRPTGEARARIVAGTGGALGQTGHGAYVCKLISTPTVSLYSAGGSMSGGGDTQAVDANESGTTVLELPAGEINLAAYCADPGGVGPDFTGTSAAFVVTDGGSIDVEIAAAPQP